MVKNPLANVKDTGSIPDLERCSMLGGRLSLWAIATEPVRWNQGVSATEPSGPNHEAHAH